MANESRAAWGRPLLAVYCGNGRYVERRQNGGHDAGGFRLSESPSAFVRRDAVAACAQARAAGLRAWLVPVTVGGVAL